MLPYSLDKSMTSCFIVAALDVEVAPDGFADQWCNDGHPSFQEVDEGGVGAELP